VNPTYLKRPIDLAKNTIPINLFPHLSDSSLKTELNVPVCPKQSKVIPANTAVVINRRILLGRYFLPFAFFGKAYTKPVVPPINQKKLVTVAAIKTLELKRIG
jgi:hypothetical protein